MNYHNRKRALNVAFALLLTLFLTLTGSTALTQDDVTSTEEAPPPASGDTADTTDSTQPSDDSPPPDQPVTDAPTEAPTEAATQAPPDPVEATDAPSPTEPTEEPIATESIGEAADEPTPTEAPTEAAPVESTPEVTAEATAEVTPEATSEFEDDTVSLLAQTFCQMDISDANDDNPFSFTFSAINANNIASFSWNLGDGSPLRTQPSFSYTYGTTGTFNVTLTCTPLPGYGAPIVLNGSITITPIPHAAFELLPGYEITQIVSPAQPLTISTVNQSTPSSGLTYQWTVVEQSSGNTVCSDTTVNISCDLTDYGEYVFTLIASVGGNNAVMTRSVTVNAPAPSATFTINPSNGIAPLIVQAEGIDLGTGPITTWSWDFNGDGSEDSNLQIPPPYTYTTDGTYTITLNYDGPGGSGSVTQTILVYAASSALTADFSWVSRGNVPGGVELCFTNLSDGDYTTAEWDFDGDGTDDVSTLQSPVCHTYSSENTYEVRLRVSRTGAFSEITRQVSVVMAPIAAFTVSPGTNITFGTAVDFDSSGSSGVITGYAWDFDGNGSTDSTAANPQDVNLTQLGPNPIRLTVTGPGGSSYTEQIIFVAQLTLTCDFTGSLSVLPTAGPQTYESVVNNLNGRTVTSFSWQITGSGAGLPLTLSTEDISVNWAGIGTGSFVVTLTVTASDGSNCTESKTVNVSFPAVTCDIASNLPGTLYPDGGSYTFTGTPGGLAGRAVTARRWFVYQNGTEVQTASGSDTLNWTNINDSTIASAQNWRVRYEIEVDNGNSTTSFCFEEVTFTTQPYPTPSCSISGNTAPIPTMPAGSDGEEDYTVTVTDPAGRTITTYAWTVGANGTLVSAPDANPMTIRWANTAAYVYGSTVNATATIRNADGTTIDVPCSQLDVNVTVPRLTCGVPIGDVNPVVNETESYSTSTGNLFGRSVTALTWTLTRTSDNFIVTGTTDPFDYQFLLPGEAYTLSYIVTVDGMPGDGCTSPDLNLTVGTNDINFDCDAFPGGFGNNFAPSSPGGSYAYTVDIDNGNGIDLNYDWVLVGPNGIETPLGSSTDSGDQYITGPAFSGSALAPFGIGIYTLRVDVSAVNPAESSHNCTLSRQLTVGSLNVSYTYVDGSGGAINANAVEVNRLICITNTSNAGSFGGIGALDYNWTIGGNPANNSLGISTSTDQQLSCLSFSQPGSYTIQLSGENRHQGDAAFRMSGQHSVTFTVYGSQSITVTRSNQTFAPATMTFQANGVNITPGTYSWRFFDSANNQIGTRSGQNVSFSFATPGQYRAVVTGQGPLGSTEASTQFELLDTNDLRASFRASQYAGIAPLRVCFTDTSVGNNILTWSWDFGNGETLVYDASSIPAEICTTYTEPARTYTPTLTITNASFTRSAQNTIRTYSPLESSATFRVIPQGNGSFCFYAEVPDGVSVTGWDFGDGTTGGAQPTICHNFNEAGSYRVQMTIQDPQGRTGTVERIITYDPNSGTSDLDVSGTCSAERTASFTLLNSGGDMPTPDQVMIYNQAGDLIFTAPVLLGAGEQQTFSVSDQSGQITFELVDDASVTASTDCYYPPEISVSAACSSNLPVFTVSNARAGDGPMAAPQDYEIRNSAGDVVASGSFQLTLNETSEQIVVPAGSNPYDTYTFVSDGAVGTFDLSHTCAEQPNLIVTSRCASPFGFTVRNTGGAMVLAQAYTITREGVEVASGSLNLGAGASQTIRLSSFDPYAVYEFSTAGFAGDVTVTHNCDRPQLAVSGVCGYPYAITVENRGGTVTFNESYTVTSSEGEVVASGTLNLGAGASQTILLHNESPYLDYTFETSGYSSITGADMNGCDRPALDVTYTCSPAPNFTIFNRGSDMVLGHSVVIADANGAAVYTGYFQIGAGESQTISIPNARPDEMYTITSDGFGGSFSMAESCAEVAALSTLLPTNQSFTGLDSRGSGLPDWSSVPTCGYNCPLFQLYHTDEVGGWEIFRLDGADEVTKTTIRENLSLGLDENVENMAPSLSPDNNWIIFQSNRDGNWELYVAPTSGGDPTAVQRVTFNTIAIDSDPTWGPNNFVVFETSRHGNWDLYLIDMATGQEYRLTDDDGDDINPFWSFDGSRIVFQSNRPDEDGQRRWQIYELNLLTRAITRLSDGTSTDVEPQYSHDSAKIAFRTYEAEGENSVLAIMDANGKVMRFSDPNGDATNIAWSPSDRYIAYQSNLDGDLDVYVYDTQTGETRQLSDNSIEDYAPTWLCSDEEVMFTSDVVGEPNIFKTEVEPITGPGILVDDDADQMTFEPSNDIYPLGAPAEENASREGQTVLGAFGEQTIFLKPDAALTPRDLSLDDLIREEWEAIEACPAA